MLMDFLVKGLCHGAYVVGLMLALSVAALILATVTAMIVFACTRGDEEDEGQ